MYTGLTGLAQTGTYFYQVFSLSSFPVESFTSNRWNYLVSLIMSLLHNPRFLCFLGIIIIMSVLPRFED